jgi:hypothetical protein
LAATKALEPLQNRGEKTMPAAPTITVSAKVIGQKKPVFTDWHIPIPPDKDRGGAPPLSLRDLITKIVLAEVEAFKQRQEARQLATVLSPQQIADGAARGKIALGGDDLKQEVDPQSAVATALLAFEDGLYYVFIDGVQVESLEQTVFVGDDTHVQFVRLVALAGG